MQTSVQKRRRSASCGRSPDGLNELGVFPRVHRRPVERLSFSSSPASSESSAAWPEATVYSRVPDGHVESFDRPDRRYGVLDE